MAPKSSCDVVTVLIDAGENVVARDEYGITPLHRAVLHEDPKNIETLLAAGGDVTARTAGGNTVFHLAAKHGRAENIQVPVYHGRDVFAKIDSVATPLHWAADCSSCNLGIFEALLSAGADATSEDEAGKTPWNFAKENLKFKSSEGHWVLNEACFK